MGHPDGDVHRELDIYLVWEKHTFGDKKWPIEHRVMRVQEEKNRDFFLIGMVK